MYEARNAAIGYDAGAVMEALDVDNVYLGEMLCLSPKLRDAILTCVIIRHCLHNHNTLYMQIVTWRNLSRQG